MDDKLSKIVNNLQKEGVDDSAINDVVQKVKEYWSYIGKFLKAKFNDETKFAIMNKTLVFRDKEICIFKPTNFNESRIIGEPICCFAYSQERWNEHYEFDQEAIYYVYDVMRYGTDEDFVAITVRPNGSALVLDKKHNWWSRHDSTRFIQGLGGGAAVITTKEGKAIKSENKEYKIYKHMNKKTIRLNESDLHRVIKESVNKVLKESNIVTKPKWDGGMADMESGEQRADYRSVYYDLQQHFSEIYSFITGIQRQAGNRINSRYLSSMIDTLKNIEKQLAPNSPIMLALRHQWQEQRAKSNDFDEPEDWHGRFEHGDFDDFSY